MDSDGFEIQGRKRGGKTREPVRDRDQASYLRDVPMYAGTSEDFERAHTRRYGREEGLGPNGEHLHGPHFPRGSDRQKLHTQYNASTHGRDVARGAYQRGLTAAEDEYLDMGKHEKIYYEENTGGLPPHQHERLDPRAREYRDKCYSNATNRETFLKAHPHGYHSKKDQDDHHGYAERAYGEYEYARNQQKHHEKHRSYSSVDKRKDEWGRPVSHR